jgi:hypothetical protein
MAEHLIVRATEHALGRQFTRWAAELNLHVSLSLSIESNGGSTCWVSEWDQQFLIQ